MRSLNFLVIGMLAFVVTGCTCRTNATGPTGEPPVAMPTKDGPLKDINFAFDSYMVDGAAKGILQGNAAWLKEHPTQKVQIEGHCDERGTNEYNQVLGANRARATMEYLRSLGIESSRMGTVSYGEELPLDPRHNEDAWAKNRRAHFNLESK